MRQIRSLERVSARTCSSGPRNHPVGRRVLTAADHPPQAVATIGLVIERQPTTVCAIGKIAAGYPCFRHDDTRD